MLIIKVKALVEYPVECCHVYSAASDRSSDKGLTLKAFPPPLRTVPQRMNPIVPSLHCRKSIWDTYHFHCCTTLNADLQMSYYRPAPQIRNIAEELDPTFHARRQDTDSLRVTQTGTVQKHSKPKRPESWRLYPSPFFIQAPHVSHFLCSIQASLSPRSSPPLSDKRTNQYAPNPKKRGKIANNNKYLDAE